MPSTIKKIIVIGGLTAFGFLAGGKLGSILGTVLGGFVCQMFDVADNPNRQLHNGPSSSSSRKFRTSKDKMYRSLECAICLERFKPSVLLIPCSHMCLCDYCYENSRDELCNVCPVCRCPIVKFQKVEN